MPIIAIDIGNSRTKIRLPDSSLLTIKNTAITNSHINNSYLLTEHNETTIVSVSSVISDKDTTELLQKTLAALKVDNYYIKTWKSTEILSIALPEQYKNLAHIGSDRALKIYYLNSLNKHKPQLCFGCGTAFTIEVVHNSVFIASKISPGLELQLNALSQAISRLSPINISEVEDILEYQELLSTRHSIVDGIISSYCSLIKYEASKWSVENIIASGGYAPLICRELKKNGINSNHIENIETLVLFELGKTIQI